MGTPNTSGGAAQPQVLLVEDDAWIRSFLLDVLADAGYRALEAADGRTGLRIANEVQPDLILLDLAMPEFTGTDVLTALRRDTRTRGIPVLILSAYANLLELRQAGPVSGVLPKPLDVSELLEAIKQALSAGGSTETI